MAAGVELDPETYRAAVARADDLGIAVSDYVAQLVRDDCDDRLAGLGLRRVATFDAEFAVYRFGPPRSRAFDVLR